jgi:hypothetical protein
MIALGPLLKKIRATYPTTRLKFLHPSLYIICEDPWFAGRSEESKLEEVASKLGIDSSELELSIAQSGAILVLSSAEAFASEYGFIETAPTSSHWLEYLSGARYLRASKPAVPVAHFYGFKGGQGRSTILAMLAQSLAEDGYKVLAIDADIEAPSLQAIFDGAASTLESTLYGCATFDLTPDPINVFAPRSGQGQIDMIACRPGDRDYDLDAANFALRSSLDPQAIQGAIGRILDFSQGKYDIVFIDHRTGLSNSSVPIIAAYPGPVAVCLRLDEQSDRADAYFDVLFKINPSNPGFFVSFSLDPEESRKSMMGKHQSKIIDLLQSISDSLGSNQTQEEGHGEEFSQPEPDEILNYWIPWFHDRNFFSGKLPSIDRILSANQDSLVAIRDLLQVSAPKKVTTPPHTAPPPNVDIRLSGSGNQDFGPLIEADALRQLRLTSSPFVYILGRKGTGKTRLLRALAEERKGEPLLVAEDYPHSTGILSNDTLIADLATQCQADPVKFWWILVDSAIPTNDRENQQASLRTSLQSIRQNGLGSLSVTNIRDKVTAFEKRRIMLIDGVETAFSAAQTPSFVEGLFRFLSTIQTDSSINHKLMIRLFIRTDLVEGARENIEQQLENRAIRLAWDTQTILNFVLARISSIEWFRQTFPDAIQQTDQLMGQFVAGSVKEEQCGSLLLQIFPGKIRRNNLGTLTFLKNYFSDGQGDRASFYPRVYDSFLRFIANGGPTGASIIKSQVEDDRVAPDLIFEAHANACKDYLGQVKDELKNMLELAPDPSNNVAKIVELLDGFNGLLTPFDLDETIEKLNAKITPRIEVSALRKALLQMKKVGIFEDRPDYPGQWRVGRLFKSSLGMRYNRRRRDDDLIIDL